MKSVLLLVLLAPSMWATSGQSLKLAGGSQTAENTSVAAQALNGACRMETQFTFTSSPSPAQIAYTSACGIIMYFQGAPASIATYPYVNGPNYPGCCYAVSTSLFASNFVMMRFQLVPSGPTSGSLIWEFWDIDGNLVASNEVLYTSLTGTARSNGAYVTSGAENLSWGFFRLYTTTIAKGSKPPTFADTGNLLEWRFNNSLADSSGNSYTATGVSPGACGSAPCYETSIGQTLVKAVIANRPVADLPPWAANHAFGGTWDTSGSCVTAPRFLDSSNSYTWSEVGGQPTVVWSSLSGPNTPTITSSTSVTSTVSGLLFGMYNIQLVATDTSANTGTNTQQIGAVEMDSNCVLIPSNSDVTKAFGPLIAFGQNPWGYQDERHLTAVEQQILNNTYYTNALWITPGTGTVSYPFSGKGPGGQTATTLCGSTSCNNTGITSSGLSIAVDNASILSLDSTELPTVIMLGPSVSGQEIVRITACTSVATGMACTGATTQAVLTVPYDGRGITGGVAAQAWTDDTVVGEYRIQGSGTLFVTDSARPLAPAGVPGPMGVVTYSTGTAGKGASSTIIAGSGTTWNTGNGVVAGYYVRLVATHDTGASFVFWSTITTVTDTTHLVLDRPLPSTIDSGTGFSYKIIKPLALSLDFSDVTVADGNTFRAYQTTISCESETSCFSKNSLDFPNFSLKTVVSQNYSYSFVTSVASEFGPNFYGTGLAARSFYLRSGWTPALTFANQIDENWTRDPGICSGLCGSSPLLTGGGGIGAILDKVTNPDTILTWQDVAVWGNIGVTASDDSCNAGDVRDYGYMLGWNALMGIFDPDATRHTAWLAALTNWATRENDCRHSTEAGYTGVQVNSWATSFNFNPNTNIGAALTLTAGSKTVTPTVAGTLIPEMCAGVDDGTGVIRVTGGSSIATVQSGSVAANGTRLYIVDTSTSPPTTVAYQYSGSGGAASTITLAGLYPNAGTHDYTFMVEDSSRFGWFTSIGVDNNQANTFNAAISLARNWACKYNNSNSITLNREWIAPVGSSPPYTNYHFGQFNVGPGFEIQPLMLGIKATGFAWGSRVNDVDIAAAFSTLNTQAGTWMVAYGTNPNTLGAPYARAGEGCEPLGTATPSPTFVTIHGGFGDAVGQCGASGLAYLPNGQAVERVNSTEAGNAYLPYYTSSPDSGRRAAIDITYGAIFGYCPYTQGEGATFYCDANYIREELSTGSLGSFKWSGFFFGVGGLFSNVWPATRFGSGVGPTITTTCPLASGIINIPYSVTLTATGSTPITWTIDSGSLPTGLSLVDDAITGTPSVGGMATFALQATNAFGDATNGPLSCSITISSVTGGKFGGKSKFGGQSKF